MFDLEDLVGLHIESYFESPYEVNGHPVPRVTEVVSKMIEEQSIIQWANSLGFKHQSYRKTLEGLAQIGSLTHHAIDLYLNGNEIPPETPQFPMDSFLLWWMNIIQAGGKKIATEQTLVCDLYGGTYDLMMEVGGRTYLVDFKTSNHITYKYWLQLAAYAKILREQQGLLIDGAVILQISKHHVCFREYILDLHHQPHIDYFDACERTFMSLLYSFYHIKYLERRFKDEWPGVDIKQLPTDKRSILITEQDSQDPK